MPFQSIDLGYLGLAQAACAFAIPHRSDPHDLTLIECGPAACIETLRRHSALRGKRVRAVFVTHVHLDHAGAAGHFAADGSDVYVHPLGARHLVDPTTLIASSRRVHGDAFDSHYGEPLPCPAERVHAVADGQEIVVDDSLTVRALATPGHAAHHHAWLVRERDTGMCAFTGDVGAMVVPGSSFISVPTPPNQFDLASWRRSLEALEATCPHSLVLTHGGTVSTDQASSRSFLRTVRHRLDTELAITQPLAEAWIRGDLSEGEAIRRYREWLAPLAERQGVSATYQAAFLGPAFCRMNLAGVGRWLAQQTGPTHGEGLARTG